MLKQFNMQLDEYTTSITELKDLVEHIKNDELTNLINQQAQKIKNTEFHVVVIGQFKRGKSTLINYFLGKDILPTGVVPITSIVTYIRFGKVPKSVISFKDYTTQDVSLEIIDQYISEQNNPQNKKNVDKIDIYYPSDILRNGIVLIDTPGIGSIYSHNTEEVYRYLPQADAAIFLISSDAPISELELEFLSEIKGYFQKMFFLQNKIDYLSETERKESLLFSTNAITKSLGKEISLYPVSARLALEARKANDINLIKSSGIDKFQEELERFLLKEKGDYLLKSYKQKINTLINDIENQINFQINILNSPIEALERQLNEFKNKAVEVTSLKKEALAFVEMDLKELIELVEKELTDFRAKNAKLIKESLINLYQQNKEMKFKELNAFLNTNLEEFIKDAYSKWDEEQRVRLREDYESIIKKFTNKLNQAITFINDITYDIFRIKNTHTLSEVTEFVDKDTFFFKFRSSSPAFLTPDLKDFLFLLPQRIRDKIMLSDLMKRVDEELEKNANNLRWDYSRKLNDSKYIFESVYQEKINNVVENIERIVIKTLELRSNKKNKIEEEVNHFEQLKSKLYKIKNRIN